MQSFDKVVILIPSLNPDEKLEKTVAGLKDVGFNDIIIVNDGSPSEFDKKFDNCENQLGCTVLKHIRNRGKGAAIKSGLRYLRNFRPDCLGVITVDADGQHLPKDVANCATSMLEQQNKVILGVRDFSLPDVPKRSRLGNKITSGVFKLLCGMKISDTQTGLRAIPSKYFVDFMKIEGNRYEYETNMLLEMKDLEIPFKEVKIETVYIEENKTSHFHPVRDSIRIYKRILKFFLNSICCTLIDKTLLWALLSFAFKGSLLIPKAIARFVSSSLNLAINKKYVFKSKQKAGPTVLKYIGLAIPQLLIETVIDKLLVKAFDITSGIGKTLIDALVCTVIFFISYNVQKNWVFKAKKENTGDKKSGKKLKTKQIVGRSVLVFFTCLVLCIVTVFSGCLVIANGPSNTVRDLLVLSAKQASATKWVPSLFLSKEEIDKIVEGGSEVTVDTMDISDVTEKTNDDEWADCVDEGVKYFTVQKATFKAYVMLVKDPTRVYVGTSSNNFATATEGMRLFKMVEKENCIAAINGGEFSDPSGMGTGAQPMGLTYSKGKRVWGSGTSNRTFIGFDKDNKLHVFESVSQAKADELGIRDAVSFQTGNTLITHEGESVKAYYKDSNRGTAQRTAIGQRADGTVIMIVTDGRTASSIGANYNDIINMMLSYGAVTAGMLDGGSSAMMYYRDYYTKLKMDTSELDQYQLQGLVNKYKAFTPPRRIPTYFCVS